MWLPVNLVDIMGIVWRLLPKPVQKKLKRRGPSPQPMIVFSGDDIRASGLTDAEIQTKTPVEILGRFAPLLFRSSKRELIPTIGGNTSAIDAATSMDKVYLLRGGVFFVVRYDWRTMQSPYEIMKRTVEVSRGEEGPRVVQRHVDLADNLYRSGTARGGNTTYFVTMNAKGVGIARFDSLRKAKKSKDYGVRSMYPGRAGRYNLAVPLITSRMEEQRDRGEAVRGFFDSGGTRNDARYIKTVTKEMYDELISLVENPST